MGGYPLQTWDGSLWRPFFASDVSLPKVVIAGDFADPIELDPALPVIARADVVERISEAHRRFRSRH